jgi:hypothetical protein
LPTYRSSVLALTAVLSAPAAAADLRLDAESGFTVPAVIRGQTLNLRVDLESPGHPILNPGGAARVGFRGSWWDARAIVGPVRLRGETNSSKFWVAGIEREHRFVWFDRDHVTGADGVISPHDLPYDNVTFRLRPEAPGEVTTLLTMEFTRGAGLVFPMTVSGRPIAVQFSTRQALTLATASAGAVVAESQSGQWAGESREALIEFGVSRPVRPMRLARPLEIGTFRVSDIFVRTGDHRGDFQLPPDAAQDPDEIVVTGNIRRQRARLFMTVGFDRLSSCSSLSYARATRQLTLRCLPLT